MYFLEQTKQYPNYNPTTLYDDIAVLKLAQRVGFSNTIQPATLLHMDGWLSPNVDVNAIGWGEWEYGTSSSILREVALVIRRDQDCASIPSYYPANQLCAGNDWKQDTCKGDSGGGLYYRGYLIGITSRG